MFFDVLQPVIDEMGAESLLSTVRRATRRKAPLPGLVYAPVMVSVDRLAFLRHVH